MFDVQVAGADAAQGYTNDGILWILNLRLWLVDQFKAAFHYVCVRLHILQVTRK